AHRGTRTVVVTGEGAAIVVGDVPHPVTVRRTIHPRIDDVAAADTGGVELTGSAGGSLRLVRGVAAPVEWCHRSTVGDVRRPCHGDPDPGDTNQHRSCSGQQRPPELLSHFTLQGV